MHIDLTPMFGQRRNAQAGIGFSITRKNIDPACQGAQTVFLDTNDLLSVVLTVQFDGCMFSIRQIHIHDRRPQFVLYSTKQNIMHFMMFMYIMYIMHIMHIMQDAP